MDPFCYLCFIFVPVFSLEKIGYINLVPKSVCRPSVMFLVTVSSPKMLDVATSNFADA